MARTPLLHAFQRLDREHCAAEALGIPVDELPGYSRREFLKRAGVTGAAPPPLPRSRSSAAVSPG